MFRTKKWCHIGYSESSGVCSNIPLWGGGSEENEGEYAVIFHFRMVKIMEIVDLLSIAPIWILLVVRFLKNPMTDFPSVIDLLSKYKNQKGQS